MKRAIGSSGVEVAPVALGGNVFDWTADEAASFAVLDAFVDAGGTMIDTADVYSAWAPGHVGGESERLIGRWLKRDPAKRDKVVIATKVGFLDGKIEPVGYDGKVDSGEYVASLHPSVIARAAEASLERMGIETIDLYYQHRDNPEVPLADSLGAFESLRAAGKIRATGLSNFSPARVEEALVAAHEGGFDPAVAVQGWYNLVERGKYEGELQDVVTGRGIGFFSYYSLANGFLTGKYRSKDDLGKSVRGGRNLEYIDSPKGKAVLAALEDVSAECGAAMATVALAWLKIQPGITAPIASATSMAQAKELIAALTLELTPGQIQALSEASA
ncbi:MAG: aldo/keto reductase [Sphingomonas sp.]|uniref:aldo/keto reductase n=1 Tax=Sphingomonas sp. TaxID=28214 RepID=UPI0017D53C2E|nr:aldo/keto reductase [Sphingomonas sp.]MBA3667434.1 aldo/keto reductase [Sphingomonas sp.]